jgi:hypothetical protein
MLTLKKTGKMKSTAINFNFSLRARLAIVFLCLLTPFLSNAQDVSFSASLNKNRVTMGETFQVIYTLNTMGSGFKGPDLSAFNIHSGPSQSTNVQFINGAMSQNMTVYYVVSPKQEGKFTIAPATIVANGKRYQSQSLSVEVLKGSAPQSRQGNQKQQNNSGNNGDYSQEINDNLFLKASVSKSNVYQGESFVLTLKVYTRVNIVDNGVSKTPALNGFWSEDIPNQKRNIELYDENVDGIIFKVGELKKSVLIPQRSGSLNIDPLEMDFIVRVKGKGRGNSFFDQVFGPSMQDVKVTIKTKPVKINVLPLPEKNKPLNFNGAVGQFSFATKVSRKELKTGESATLTLSVNGSGNLNLLDFPTPEFPPDFESYEPKSNEKYTVSVNGINGSKSVEYLFIPRAAGNYSIPAIDFSYFNPELKKYVSIEGSPFDFLIEKGVGEEAQVIAGGGTSKREVKMLGKDVRFVKSNLSDLCDNKPFFGTAFFWFLLLLPIGTTAFVGFTLQRIRNNPVAESLLLSRKAQAIAKARLKHAASLNNPQHYNAFFEEIFRTIYGYISDGFLIPKADLNREKISSVLSQKGVHPDRLKQLMDLMDVCEMARFSPVKNPESMANAYNASMDLITHLEKFKTA